MKPREFYNEVALIYNTRHDSPPTKWLRKKESAFIAAYAKGKILDVGCGTGTYLRPGVVGLDISEKMLLAAKKKSSNLVQGNETLPFRSGTFDTILCMFTVANMMDVRTFAKDAFRVLRPGGHIILSVASIYDNKMQPSKTVQVAGKKLSFSLFTKEELLNIFSTFSLEEFSGIFIDMTPDWGGFRPFTAQDRLRLKKENTYPQEQGRIYLLALRRPE